MMTLTDIFKPSGCYNDDNVQCMPTACHVVYLYWLWCW